MTTKKKAPKKTVKKKAVKKSAVKKVVKKAVKKKVKKNADKITKNMSIADVVKRYPETIEVFFNYDLHCVGCAAAEFDTIESGALVHGVNVQHILFDLNKAIK